MGLGILLMNCHKTSKTNVRERKRISLYLDYYWFFNAHEVIVKRSERFHLNPFLRIEIPLSFRLAHIRTL